MRRLTKIYPQFADRVDFYAISVDPTETADILEEDKKRGAYPWPVATTNRQLLADLRIVQQSTKVAFDSRGVIVYRAGYGKGDEETWKRVLEDLAASAAGD